ncbi:hypothetical protein C8Q76DRAFT_621798 [Earliella scabrosa]|nr:hypothetical protein C8Q76DRAFT_621798 [Earliella scabrosa]
MDGENSGGLTDTDKAKRSNQHKPLPPASLLYPRIRYYFALGLTDAKIAENTLRHFDSSQYGLSDTSVKRIRTKLGLKKTRQQGHTIDSIHTQMMEIKKRFPTAGFNEIAKKLRLNYNIFASRAVIQQWCHRYEPDAVEARKHRKFKRYRFWAAGVNDFWTFDQHDKWGPRFGLWLHVGTEPVSGEIKWLRIWWNNSNPRLVTKYYLDAVRKTGGIPLVTQSDPGSENFGVANAHTYIRHTLDSSLQGTLQHRWMRKRMNIKPEIVWSILARQWKPGFEGILQLGVDQGWYDPSDPLDTLIFRWLAIPWLQAELDVFVKEFNHSPRRACKHKVLPHGIPVLIAADPHAFGVEDFKIRIPNELIDTVEAEWAPPDHPVFQLVPPAFQIRISAFAEELGSPQVTSDSFWQVYLLLKQRFAHFEQENPLDYRVLTEQAAHHANVESCIRSEPIHLFPGLRDVRSSDSPIGSTAHPQPHAVYAGYSSDGEGDMVQEAVNMDTEPILYRVFSSDEEDLDEDDPGML